MQTKKLHDPYLKDIWLVWGFTPAEVNKWFVKNRIACTPWAKSGAGRFLTVECNGCMLNLLLLPRGCQPSTLAHELVHLAWEILHRQSGIGFSNESEEAFAYYMTYMFAQCSQLMKTKRKKATSSR